MALVIDICILFLLVNICRIYAPVSAAIAYVFGLLAAYTLLARYVFFDGKNTKSEVSRKLQFFVVGIFGVVFSYLCIVFFYELLSLELMLSKALTACIHFVVVYLIRKTYVFRS